MKNNGIKENFFSLTRTYRPKIFCNSIIQTFNGILIKFQIMELKKIRMITIKMSF